MVAHSVDIVVSSLVALYRDTWSDVGEQGECPSEGQVKRDVSFSDGSSERTFQSDSVLLDTVDGRLRNGGFTVDEDRCDVYLLPLDWGL